MPPAQGTGPALGEHPLPQDLLHLKKDGEIGIPAGRGDRDREPPEGDAGGSGGNPGGGAGEQLPEGRGARKSYRTGEQAGGKGPGTQHRNRDAGQKEGKDQSTASAHRSG